MTFLHPEFIYLMLPILIVLFAMLVTQSEKYEQFFSAAVLERLRVESDQFSTRTRNIFYFLMMLFLILGLAEPVIERGTARLLQPHDTLYIVIDSSTSDLKSDLLSRHIEKVNTLKVGVVLLGDALYLLSPLTSDHILLKERLAGVKRVQGVVDLASSLKVFVSSLAQEHPLQFLILSDKGRVSDSVESTLKAAGIGVDAVKVATSEGELDAALQFYRARIEAAEHPIYWHLFIIPIGMAMLMFIFASSSFYRGEKYHLPLFLLLLSLGAPERADAAFFGDEMLEDARTAYEEGAYLKSAHAYEKYGLKHESREAIYDAANSYYRAGAYDKAVRLYRSIHFIESEKNHALYYNLANALIHRGEENDLHAALAAYKKALTMREDPLVRESLNSVRYELKRGGVSASEKVRKDHIVVKKRHGKSDVKRAVEGIDALFLRAAENNRGHLVRLPLDKGD